MLINYAVGIYRTHLYYVYDTGDTNIKMRRTKWQQEDSAYNLLSFSVAIYEVCQYVF